MRLLFIRHAEPDYKNDTLTEKGRREARLLGDAAPYMNLGTCYVSPLGRAKDTAAYCMETTGKTAEVLDWLHEFQTDFDLEKSETFKDAYSHEQFARAGTNRPFWDIFPAYWNQETSYFDPVRWRECPLAKECNLVSVYDYVSGRLDSLLAGHGYVRDGSVYRVEKESDETLTFFCHLGIMNALVAHLWDVSPFTFWFHLWVAPSSVTELITEERVKGIAQFRGARFGDISHLYAGREEPSHSGRFCECYDRDTR